MQYLEPPREKLEIILDLLYQKKFSQSLSLSKDLKNDFPESIILCNFMGASYSGLKQFKNAINSYKKAIQLKPDFAEAYFNMGFAYKNISEYNSAIDSYRKAIFVNPKYAEASYNLGNIFKILDEFELAEKHYNQAVRTNPNYFEAHFNLGNILLDNDEHIKAIESYLAALKIKPNSIEVYKSLSNIFTKLVFTGANPDVEQLIISIFDQKTIIKPIALSRAAISLLKFDPTIKELIDIKSSIDIDNSIGSIVSNLSSNRLLLKLMSISLIPDTDLEAVLRNIRYSIIKSIHKVRYSPELMLFQSALALHCFTNEYIYHENNEEVTLIKALENEIKTNFSEGTQPQETLILCLASYKPLHQYEWSKLLENVTHIKDVVLRQIIEPKQENKIKSKLSNLLTVSNHISSKVKEQYESNPYPRWVNTGLSKSSTIYSEINNKLDLKLSDKRIYEVDNPSILIAGCGTGQHSIRVASKFKEAKVLAIDLSSSSLAYAKRKTKELGIKNINYMQADILDLDKLNRKFDMIQSSGVLHHMDNPMAGWQTLKKCLKTGGLMKIGLYSNLARQHIVKIREEVKLSGINLDDESIKLFRYNLITSKEIHHKKIQVSNNFFSLSEIRDLLFHVQEHRFTITEIKKCIESLNLNFCGFDSEDIIRDFKKNYPSKNELYNLETWNQYENNNPNSFVAMYQFWCQRLD